MWSISQNNKSQLLKQYLLYIQIKKKVKQYKNNLINKKQYKQNLQKIIKKLNIIFLLVVISKTSNLNITDKKQYRLLEDNCYNYYENNSLCQSCINDEFCQNCKKVLYKSFNYNSCLNQGKICLGYYSNIYGPIYCDKDVQNCSLQREGICVSCFPPYQINQVTNQCDLSCKYQYQGCFACNNNQQCIECSQGYELIDNRCYQRCSKGQYIEPNTNICQSCKFPCLECSGTNDFCTVCNVEGALLPYCNCPQGQYIFKNRCIPIPKRQKECDFYERLNEQNECIEICDTQSNYYPIFSDSNNIYCDRYSNYFYCDQQFKKIEDLISFSVKSFDTYLEILVNLPYTYVFCYQYTLRLISYFELRDFNNFEQSPHLGILKYKIMKSDFNNYESLIINKIMNFEFLIQKENQQRLFQFQYSISSNSILENSMFVFYENEQTLQPVCPNCEIPDPDKITPKIGIKCQKQQFCSQNKINLATQEQITVVIKDDLNYAYFNPYNVYIEYIFSGPHDKNLNQHLEFQSSNQINGQIEMTFNVINTGKGKLFISGNMKSGVVNKNKIKRFSKFVYPVIILDIEIFESQSVLEQQLIKKDTDTEPEEPEPNQNLTIILTCCFGGIFSLSILVFCYIRRKRLQKKSKEIKKEPANGIIESTQDTPVNQT